LVLKATKNELQKMVLQLRFDLMEMIGVGKADSLGHGLSIATGMALALRLDKQGSHVCLIIGALNSAEKVKGKPTVIVADTIKGKGFSFVENSAAFHKAVLSAELYNRAVAELERKRHDLENSGAGF
jgi:transketolase N-terminal domain/subunit